MGEKKKTRDWAALIEAAGVFLLTMLYIWWLRLEYPWLWVTILGFVVSTHFLHYESPRRLGFAWSNLQRAARPVITWVMVFVLGLLALGFVLGTIRRTTPLQALAGAGAYILWGLFQQYLLNGYFTNRLLEFSGNSRMAPLAAGLLFAAVHLPNWFLMLVTFIGGYLSARVYLRYRSLYVLGLAHGIIGFVLLMIAPDSISGHFLIGPRYLLDRYGTYPEQLL